MRLRGFEDVSLEHSKLPHIVASLPIRSDARSAGYDFFSKETFLLMPGQKHLFWTDVKAYMQNDEMLSLHVRSSLGTKHGIVLANSTGIIDASYYNNPDNDGNIGICLKNTSNVSLTIKMGERIAQGVFQKYLLVDNDNTLNDSRSGGFGSSGR